MPREICHGHQPAGEECSRPGRESNGDKRSGGQPAQARNPRVRTPPNLSAMASSCALRQACASRICIDYPLRWIASLPPAPCCKT
jgi:hypothetical protein